MFQPFDKPLPLKLIYNFSHLMNLCRGNLKIIEIVSAIEPWVEFFFLCSFYFTLALQ